MFLGAVSQELSANSVLLGVIVGITSTSIQSLGLTLQRKSHLLEDQCSHNGRSSPVYRRRMWQLGFVLFVLSNLVGSSVQITTLPLLVLSALQVAGLIFNALCASLLLDEPLTRYSLFGTLLASVGAILIAVFGSMPESAHNLTQLLVLFVQPGFVLWIAAQCLLVVALGTTAFCILSAGRSVGPQSATISGILYGTISGSLSAHTLLLAKTAVELFIRTILDHDNQFRYWQSWLILVLLLALAVTQLYFLNRGLKFLSTSVLYPMVFCIYSITAILDALIYYRQYQKLTLKAILLVALGTFIMLVGVILLSWRFQARQFTPVEGQSDRYTDEASHPLTSESETPCEPAVGPDRDSFVRGSKAGCSAQKTGKMSGRNIKTVTFQAMHARSASWSQTQDNRLISRGQPNQGENESNLLILQLWEDLEES